MSKDKVVVKGEIIKTLPDFRFRVLTEHGNEVLAYGSGTIRRRKKMIQPGDKVLLEISVYDMGKGRLIEVLS